MIRTNYTGPGKNGRLLIISGVHGNEYGGISVVNDLKKFYATDLTKIYGEVEFLEMVNEHGIINNKREDEEGNDLNRLYNNQYINTETTEALKSIIVEYDYIIDVHASPNCIPFVLISNNEYANSYVEFCIRKHLDYGIWDNASPNTIKQLLLEQNKTVMTYEITGVNSVEVESYQKSLDVLFKIASIIYQVKTKKSPNRYECLQTIEAPISGIKTTPLNEGDLCRIKSLDDEEIAVTIPEGYTVVAQNRAGYVKAGDSLGLMQKTYMSILK